MEYPRGTRGRVFPSRHYLLTSPLEHTCPRPFVVPSDYPRGTRGVAATRRPWNIHGAPAASPRLVSPWNLHAAPAPRYACAAAAPRGGGDGAVFLAVGINGSLVACFLGAGLATRKGAMISPAAGDAIVGAGLGLVAVAGGASALFGRPATALPGILVVAGSWLVRAADGFCSPLFYRRIHEVSGSVDVLQWAGILSIWVVNLGIWATLVVVVSMNYA